jgi:3-hydroxybutyrate dehydrogenase
MLEGKTALVTGSTSGIGLGIACALARQGARLMLNGFGDVEGALATVRALGGEVDYHGADMSKPAEIAAMVAACETRFGSVDVRWDAIIAINLSSAFHAMHAALPGMKARNWGRVLNIASAHGLVASAGKSAYVAAKHGIVGLTKAAALETATSGVTVNAICPGWVLTPLVQKQVDARAAAEGVSNDEAKRRLLADKQPSLQFTTPEELGELAVFLCSAAAQNVRGVAWAVDGGWVAQ